MYNGGTKGTAASLNLYLNGTLIPTGTYDFGTAGGVGSNCNILGADGNSGCNVALSAYHSGEVALYRIYNRVLSATEILQVYNAQRTRFGV